MKKDFTIGQSNELLKDGKVYDLHNLYDVSDISLINNKETLEITFRPNTIHGMDYRTIKLKFIGVEYLEFSLNCKGGFVSDLEEIGYKQPKDRDMAWLQTEEQSTSEDHMFFRLEGGNFIRVHSMQALLHNNEKVSEL